MSKNLPKGVRPDLIDMAGEEYDLESPSGAEKTLIICSAPRTGSYELCRFLMAAGAGIPHEYFHPQFAQMMAARWGFVGNPLSGNNIELYCEALRRKRSQGGLFAVNIQYWQFTENLMNLTGVKLFNGATVIYLSRPDVLAQIISWRVAMATGIWDFSGRPTSEPRKYPDAVEGRVDQFLADQDFVLGEDSGFRKFFALSGIVPIRITMDDLFRAPRDLVSAVARSFGLEPNIPALDEMIAGSKPYPPNDTAKQQAYGNLAPHLQGKAFGL